MRGRAAVAALAAVFGVATLFAGGRVLAGADPGYVVFRPLLLFNTAMGAAYLAAAAATWWSLERGRLAAAAIAAANVVVLAAVAWLYAAGSAVAAQSVRAMTLRAGVWVVLWLALSRMARTGAGSRPLLP